MQIHLYAAHVATWVPVSDGPTHPPHWGYFCMICLETVVDIVVYVFWRFAAYIGVVAAAGLDNAAHAAFLGYCFRICSCRFRAPLAHSVSLAMCVLNKIAQRWLTISCSVSHVQHAFADMSEHAHA